MDFARDAGLFLFTHGLQVCVEVAQLAFFLFALGDVFHADNGGGLAVNAIDNGNIHYGGERAAILVQAHTFEGLVPVFARTFSVMQKAGAAFRRIQAIHLDAVQFFHRVAVHAGISLVRQLDSQVLQVADGHAPMGVLDEHLPFAHGLFRLAQLGDVGERDA